MRSFSGAPEVIVVRTGLANTASMMVALERTGLAPKLSQDAREVLDAPMVVLPGVGAFGPAMEGLRSTGLDRAIAERVAQGGPLLAVCLGLQMLCTSSEESPGIAGLGVVRAPVTRLRPGPGERVPHLGWNGVAPGPGFTLAGRGMAYFANSYKVDEIPGASEGWSGCTFDHGGVFVAALQQGSLLACQFHPELSGAWGAGLIRRWAQASLSWGGMRCSAAV
jgi:imidazole glycerol phosphate synthase glutamine amidotransferase subunit